MTYRNTAVELLEAILQSHDKTRAVHAFQQFVWALPAGAPDLDERLRNLLNDLALDLDYFVANPAWRAEDPSYFGEGRLIEEVREALTLLTN